MKRSRRIDQGRRIVFRGTELDNKRLARIRALVADHRGWKRQELAREVCRIYGWRRPNGAWAVRGAHNLLGRLDKLGVIELPAPRQVQGRPERAAVRRAAALIGDADAPAAQAPAVGQSSRAALVVRPIQAEELLFWRAHMERFHYLGDGELVGESRRYVALLDGAPVALLSWAAAALRNGPRDRYVGTISMRSISALTSSIVCNPLPAVVP